MLSRVFRVGTALVVLGLMTANAQAQGGGRGGPGGGRGFGGPRGTASDMLNLLSAAEVRKEVGLSDEGGQAVDKLLKEAEESRAAMFGGRGGPGGGGPGGPGGGDNASDEERTRREEFMKTMRERMAEMQKKVDEAALGAMSDSQKKALEELKGAKFEFPESLRNGMGMMGGRGFGGFGGGPGGPGGGGGGGRGQGGGGQGGPGGFDMEKWRAQREEAAKKAQEVLDEVLPPEGMSRLIGLYVQLNGNSAATGELPAKKLGLSEADIEKINEAVGVVRREAMQGFGPPGGGGGRQGRNRPNAESGT